MVNNKEKLKIILLLMTFIEPQGKKGKQNMVLHTP